MNQPANLTELLKLAKGTRYESVAGDEQEVERLFLDALKNSADPMTREIGSGIADGSMTWQDVATSSAYAEHLGEHVEAMRDFDPAAALGALAEEDASAEESEEDEPAANDEDDGDDDGDVFTGVMEDRE